MPRKIPQTLSLVIVALSGLSAVSILILSIEDPKNMFVLFTWLNCIRAFISRPSIFYMYTYRTRAYRQTGGIRKAVLNRFQLNREMLEIADALGLELVAEGKTGEYVQHPPDKRWFGNNDVRLRQWYHTVHQRPKIDEAKVFLLQYRVIQQFSGNKTNIGWIQLDKYLKLEHGRSENEKRFAGCLLLGFRPHLANGWKDPTSVPGDNKRNRFRWRPLHWRHVAKD